MSLLNTFQRLLTGGVVDKLASLVGGNSSLVKSALTSVLPSLLRGIISKGSTSSGAGQLLDLIKNNKLGANMTPDASSMKIGEKLNDSIFGSALKDINVPGLSGEKRSSLLNAATPMLMGSLGKIVKDKNLDAAGLSSFLQEEGKGLAATASDAKVTSTSYAKTDNDTGGGLGFIKWLLPLLLLGGLAWWFMNKDKSATVEDNTRVEQKATHTTTSGHATHTHSDGTVHEGHSHGNQSSSSTGTASTSATTTATTSTGSTVATSTSSTTVAGYTIDGDGNLLKDGVIYLKKGQYTMKDGEYFDADGKSLGFIGKVGKAIGDAGKAVGGAVGDAGKAVGGAVGGAAEKTADFFKGTFGGMFKKKSAGTAVAAYTLSQITFDPTSHKITNFSKNEIQGLASALKAYPDSKITVNAGGSDGKVAKMRATVIHDMLVTLGVADKQIDAKGSEGAESYSIMVN